MSRKIIFSSEEKIKACTDYLSGAKSASTVTLRRWIKQYNSHIELKDYDPKPEVYMTDILKTTLEERIAIVKDCLEHGRDVKNTAAKYGCNYAQLYQWVRKYEADGESALADKRGKRKMVRSALDDIENEQFFYQT